MSNNEEIIAHIRCRFKLTDPLIMEIPIDIDRKKLREQMWDMNKSVKMVDWGYGWVELEITNPIWIETLVDEYMRDAWK